MGIIGLLLLFGPPPKLSLFLAELILGGENLFQFSVALTPKKASSRSLAESSDFRGGPFVGHDFLFALVLAGAVGGWSWKS